MFRVHPVFKKIVIQTECCNPIETRFKTGRPLMHFSSVPFSRVTTDSLNSETFQKVTLVHNSDTIFNCTSISVVTIFLVWAESGVVQKAGLGALFPSARRRPRELPVQKFGATTGERNTPVNYSGHATANCDSWQAGNGKHCPTRKGTRSVTTLQLEFWKII